MLLLDSVLLVDDDATATFLHQSLLRRMKVAAQVLVAENGQQALNLLASAGATPALILLDLNMPVLNGWEFLARFAALPLPAPRPVVVVLSSSTPRIEQARTQGLPIAGFLEKPLTREKVAAVLQQHFGAAAQG